MTGISKQGKLEKSPGGFFDNHGRWAWKVKLPGESSRQTIKRGYLCHIFRAVMWTFIIGASSTGTDSDFQEIPADLKSLDMPYRTDILYVPV